MALPKASTMTVAEFSIWTQRPENSAKRFELLNGKVIEVPSNPFASVIAARLITQIGMYLLQNEIDGHVSGEGGGFIINGQVFAPDVAYSRDLPTNKGYEDTPPLLAVEVISDPHSNTEQTDLRRKLAHYMRAGIVTWIVDYVAKQVEVHIPGGNIQLCGADDMLAGGDVLPGFALHVKDIFPADQ